MSGFRSYRVLRDRELRGVKFADAGAIVHDAKLYDYGCAADDTAMLGVRHISVTLEGDGGYPFFTIPFADLEDIGPAPFSSQALKDTQ